MNRSLLTLLLLTITLPGLGCVAQRKYDQLKQSYQKSQEQVTELQEQVDQLNQRIEQLKSKAGDEQARIDELTAERDRLMSQLEQLKSKYKELAAREPVALPQEVDKALREFAEKHGDLVTYDSEKGMVKFKSDLTFGLGSAELKPDARNTLDRLGDLLTDPAASDYEVRVVGHTDSVPIERPSTKKKHPTNWHLSVHRAISVRDALQQGGLPPVRTGVCGYSKYRPLVQNAPSGAEKNRRVEIYLLKMPPVNESYISPGGGGSSASRSSSDSDGDDIPLK